MAKILIVDDSGLSRRMMRAILESAGHQVIEASDGLMAIERYLLDRPDLVLLDLLMSNMNGVEVLEKIRQIDSAAQVIVATADLQTLTRAIVKEAGAKSLINKPFTAPVVLEAVNAVLEGVTK